METHKLVLILQKTLTLNLPSSVVPTIGTPTITINNP